MFVCTSSENKVRSALGKISAFGHGRMRPVTTPTGEHLRTNNILILKPGLKYNNSNGDNLSRRFKKGYY